MNVYRGYNFKNFYSSDSENTFLENSKKMSASNVDWDYFNKTINYKFNSYGYRTDEWSDINWQESIVIFGCSHVLGEGLAEEDTITGQLSRLLNKPVINLGVSGTGISFNSYNSLLLYKNLPKPYAVVQLWSSISRIELYTPEKMLLCLPATIGDKHDHMHMYRDAFYKEWSRFPENYHTHLWFNAQFSKSLWENITKYYECTLFFETENLLKCKFFEIVDRSRDLLHPGIKTTKILAENIAENIS